MKFLDVIITAKLWESEKEEVIAAVRGKLGKDIDESVIELSFICGVGAVFKKLYE
jgi:hypothetical protein|nr:MAG TPA: hypothetical protein [Caudoviricetes sp.]